MAITSLPMSSPPHSPADPIPHPRLVYTVLAQMSVTVSTPLIRRHPRKGEKKANPTSENTIRCATRFIGRRSPRTTVSAVHGMARPGRPPAASRRRTLRLCMQSLDTKRIRAGRPSTSFRDSADPRQELPSACRVPDDPTAVSSTGELVDLPADNSSPRCTKSAQLPRESSTRWRVARKRERSSPRQREVPPDSAFVSITELVIVPRRTDGAPLEIAEPCYDDPEEPCKLGRSDPRWPCERY